MSCHGISQLKFTWPQYKDKSCCRVRLSAATTTIANKFASTNLIRLFIAIKLLAELISHALFIVRTSACALELRIAWQCILMMIWSSQHYLLSIVCVMTANFNHVRNVKKKNTELVYILWNRHVFGQISHTICTMYIQIKFDRPFHCQSEM